MRRMAPGKIREPPRLAVVARAVVAVATLAAHLAFKAIQPAVEVGTRPAGEAVVAIDGFEARDLSVVVLQAIGFATGQAAVS